ncbi:hypothetical protein GIB67_012630 [Kingdonia uniflora]|uniref:K Homology domain-containing protein n=1 Tax=Kingdonia uniflora TaxID=39325 RepID=A0A7J7NF87_9MAGN|nr:hypothetical protein GIB67_012630 [Kingdonia uniflora]
MGKNNKKPFSFRQRPPQFENKKGFKKVRRQNSSHERRDATPGDAETVYRLLCPAKKIGSVIGKGGDIIKAIRDETYAKIKVAEAVPGTDERVVLISSSSTRQPKTGEDLENTDPSEKEQEEMLPHCPAQHALLKVHQRIAEDDYLYGGGTVNEDDKENDVITARLLVPTNQVGCLLGKGGHVINELRSETGANIRILAAEHLPACAMSTDELVQISGTSAVAMRALYEVSTRLHQNPRPPMNHPSSAGVPRDIPPQRNPMWSQKSSGFHGAPPMPRFGGHGNEPSRFPPGGFNGFPARNNGNASAEFSMKILCPTEKIGLVIGKGGSTVNQIQQATRTDIHVDRTTPESDEHAIIVSSFDAPWNPISPTIEAIVQLQNTMVQLPNSRGDISEVTTRLLVPSTKVGCLLGQGGHIINEMRRRSKADIRIISDDGKPLCASKDEELVQISGNVIVARDALVEISSRLRMRSLEGLAPAAEPGPVGPSRRFGSSNNFFERALPPSGMIGSGSSSGYEQMKGGYREYGPQTFPFHAPNPGFPNINGSMEVKIPNSAMGSVLAAGGSNISSIGQMSGAKIQLNDAQSGGSDCVVEIRGSSEQMNAAQNLLQTFIASAVQSLNARQQQSPYASAGHNFNQRQHHDPYASSAQNLNLQQHPYAATAVQKQQQDPYASAPPNFNQQQDLYAAAVQKPQEQQHQDPYASAVQNFNQQEQLPQPQQDPYTSALQNFNQQKDAYASAVQQQQDPYASVVQHQQQDPYASAPHNYNQQQQDQYAGAAHTQQQDLYASGLQHVNSQQQVHYAAAAQKPQQLDPYASAGQQQQQLDDPYASAVLQPQPQDPYASGLQASAQQQDAYASAVQNYNQQQQDLYAPGVQNPNAQQQQGSYDPSAQSYESQQQGPYQY